MDRDDFELGDEPVEVICSPRVQVAVTIRLSRTEAERLQCKADQLGQSLSHTARDAVTRFLSDLSSPPSLWNVQSVVETPDEMTLQFGADGMLTFVGHTDD